jgi:hypothetical protein
MWTWRRRCSPSGGSREDRHVLHREGRPMNPWVVIFGAIAAWMGGWWAGYTFAQKTIECACDPDHAAGGGGGGGSW